jgi:hypothetical protein
MSDMNSDQIHEKADSLVKNIEAGDRSSLQKELDGMSLKDRVAVAREMQKINEQDRQKDGALPVVEIAITKDAGGEEHIKHIGAGSDERHWFNPKKWFGDNLNNETYVYKSEWGSGMLSQATDSIKEHNRKLQEAMNEK